MSRTAGRVLRLLALLQGRRIWTGTALSERLMVDARTIRRDVERLRELGYAIEASAGPGGGYRLGAGNSTPPLLLEDDEAVTVAVALTAAAGSVAGTEEVALRVLVKLDQLLPPRLKRRMSALHSVTVPLVRGQPMADPAVLTTLTTACLDHEVLRFTYRDRQGEVTQRTVEPAGLVHTGRVWYLAAWDRDRAEWRTFRVDRIDTQSPLTRAGRFTPKPPPEDIATYVSRSISAMPYRHFVRVRIEGSHADVVQRVPRWVGVLEPHDQTSCVLTIGGETPEALAHYLVHLGMDFTLIEPHEMVEALQAIARRLLEGTRTVARQEPRAVARDVGPLIPPAVPDSSLSSPA
jgi:predicted DNA-binding transcriptional regulator YafY